MICPKCMKQRSFWGTHCPHCTHEVSMDEQFEWSFSLWALKAAAVLGGIALLILIDNIT